MARARSWAAICVQDFDAPCVLQFAWVNALCCALHRSTSQVIHRSGSYNCVLFTRCIVRALAAIADAKVPTSNYTSRRQQQYLVLVVRVSAERVGRQQWGRERASVRLSPPVEVCTPPIRQTGETSARARSRAPAHRRLLGARHPVVCAAGAVERSTKQQQQQQQGRNALNQDFGPVPVFCCCGAYDSLDCAPGAARWLFVCFRR